jgi:hypothetical protein
MSRPLLTFSTLSLVYGKQQQQDGKQQPIKKIKIKPKNTVVVVGSTNSETEKTQEHGQACSTHSCEKVNECEQTTHPLPLITPSGQKKKIIIIKKRENVEEKRENVEEKRSYNDIAPPATMICKPQSRSDIYYRAPHQQCCRFFIENKHCFLRERDNACISPISRTVFGFWNEEVGKECKLLPVEDETTYEEAMPEIPLSSPIMKSKSQKSPKKIDLVTKSPKKIDLVTKSPKKIDLVTKSPKKIDLVTKSRFVSDAQRARVASEPLALLREKIAKQYGMTKKN